eukprot:TRINITY_DN12023_c0_g1_i2.p1 TRINITY_DN12023_c0_g1~~TRINITY_DN12023_c0_g1_i2.p1  ORF type:complete len:284 (-),score=54.24 TRINITY_DN12023_c0_g1_i2:12-863(-)
MKSTRERRRMHLTIDFDGTITSVDTTASIVLLGRKRCCDSKHFDQTWKEVSETYYSEYEQTFNDELNKLTSTPFLDREDQMNRLIQFSQQVKDLELKTIAKIQKVQLLKNIQMDDMHTLAKELELHDDCVETISRAIASGFRVRILSANWCKEMIRKTLEENKLMRIPIDSNELEIDGHLTTGSIKGGIHSAIEKEEFFMKFKEGEDNVYIGDSVTDLLSLLAADVGILFRPSKSTRNFCEKFDIQLEKKEDYVKNKPMTLLLCDSWKEVAEWMGLSITSVSD